jgi:hypothetical protein
VSVGVAGVVPAVVGAAFGSVVVVVPAVVGAAFGSVVVVVPAVVGAAFWVAVGSADGAPTESLTTGAFANGSVVADAPCCDVDGATWECESETTGSLRCTTRVTGVCVRANAGVEVVACAAVGAGSGARGASFGTCSSGNAMFGIATFGSGFVGAATNGCLNTAATGPAYIATSTTTPSTAHTYRTPRERSATKPYGFAAATAE